MLERAFLSAQAAVLLVLAGCDRTPSSNSTTKARSAGETASVVAVPPTAKASESTASAGALVVPASQIHQPSGLSPGERRPLLIFLHGLGASGKVAFDGLHLAAFGARERVFVLAPDGSVDRQRR